MLPKVTVLMTVYNGERYLQECIDSVLNQTFEDFEFIIIDDSSTDSSIDIIKSYSDSRIHIIQNERNLNQVRSLNIGLTHARGEYVARIDQDDIMSKYRLKRQVEFLDKRPDICVVGTWGEVINEKGDVFTRSRLPIRSEEIVANVLFAGYFLMHPSVVFRKAAVIDIGKYNEEFSFAEDYDLWTRLLLKRHKFSNIPAYLIKFRYHKKSSSRQFPEVQLNNVRISISNFIRNISGERDSPEMDSLCNLLISMGLMNRDFFMNDVYIDLQKIMNLLDSILKKTACYFNFNINETYLMKKIFCNRLLNFIFQSHRIETSLSMGLYSYCLRNYFFILQNPKLYAYPFVAPFLFSEKK